jgi:hypothetical protein
LKRIWPGDFGFNRLRACPVFILATGDSLLLESKSDLSSLAGFYTIGTNDLAGWEDLPFVPSMWVNNERVHPETHSYVEKHDLYGFCCDEPMNEWAINTGRWRPFRRSMGTSFGSGLGNFTGDYATSPDREAIKIAGFEPEFDVVMYQEGMSVGGAAIQSAIWMGFDPIYLLGVDVGKDYVHGRKNRLSIHEPGGVYYEPLARSLEPLRVELEERGRKLVNLSQGAREDVLSKARLSDVLSELLVVA